MAAIGTLSFKHVSYLWDEAKAAQFAPSCRRAASPRPGRGARDYAAHDRPQSPVQRLSVRAVARASDRATASLPQSRRSRSRSRAITCAMPPTGRSGSATAPTSRTRAHKPPSTRSGRTRTNCSRPIRSRGYRSSRHRRRERDLRAGWLERSAPCLEEATLRLTAR